MADDYAGPYTNAQLSDGTTLRFKGDLDPISVKQKVTQYRAGVSGAAPTPTPGALNPGTSKTFAQHPSSVEYRDIRERESPEKIAGRQGAAQNVITATGDLGTAAGLTVPAAGLVTAPLATVGALGGSFLGGEAGKYGARALGAGQDVQDIAQIGGGLAGGIAGGALADRIEIPERIKLPFGMSLPTGSLANTAPAVPISKDPNMSTLEGMRAARAALRNPETPSLGGMPTSAFSATGGDLPVPSAGPLTSTGGGLPTALGDKPSPSLIVSPNSPPPSVEGSYWSFPEENLRQTVLSGDRDAAIVYKQRFGKLPAGAGYLTDVGARPNRGLYQSAK